MFIDNLKKFIELGISDKYIFTDEERADLPDVSVLHPLYKEYKSIEASKNAADTALANAQAHNANPPDHSTEIAEKEAEKIEKQDLITAIETEITTASMVDRLQMLEPAKAEYEQDIANIEAQIAELEQDELQIDTTTLQANADNLASQLSAKAAEVNAECSRIGIGDLV